MRANYNLVGIASKFTFFSKGTTRESAGMALQKNDCAMISSEHA